MVLIKSAAHANPNTDLQRETFSISFLFANRNMDCQKNQIKDNCLFELS